ncbi:hypothetical protein D1Q00_gp033 [Trichoplusia ni granulovirus LBIV-12]|jgi:hypothetical protein|uniref:Uncharacterized protein n=2 Tax=Betabaculovirus TaxID=558017 RepID=A0A1D8QL38_GVTN|nr:hypothetical protein PsunGV_gp037 [Pseudalatia unipuncta granulovirus]YP_009506103.1 hypothetical protein D1Q00_gp033 [Trichoplusia ni granulovirus LBIV-12]ACH69387.1 unknown [Pseudalatia unipuncta granulovirus]AOW41372.1 hypothetical protein [Trichoplusia ni granulovirus LBIV-12]
MKMEAQYYLQYQLNMMQKEAEKYKEVVDNLLLRNQQDQAEIKRLTDCVEGKTAEVAKLDTSYKDIVVSLVDQIKHQEEEITKERKLNQSLKKTLKSFRGKSKTLNEQSYRVQRMKRTIDLQNYDMRKMKSFIKNTIDLLDDVCDDAESLLIK